MTETAIHNILYKLNLIIDLIQIISETKLTIGGAAILLIIVKNHKNDSKGIELNMPFDIIILRLPLRV